MLRYICVPICHTKQMFISIYLVKMLIRRSAYPKNQKTIFFFYTQCTKFKFLKHFECILIYLINQKLYNFPTWAWCYTIKFRKIIPFLKSSIKLDYSKSFTMPTFKKILRISSLIRFNCFKFVPKPITYIARRARLQ